jgi:tetratricopeptide (TPR) repeat protein
LQQLEAERLLASIAIDQRDYDEAVRRLEASLQLVKSVGIASLIASVLCDLANAYLKSGARQQALAAVGEAVRVASDIDLPSTAAEALMAIGNVRSQLKEFGFAEAAYCQAKDTYASIGNLHGQLDALHALAWLYHETDQGDAKINVAREALEIAKSLNNPETIRNARMQLALALSDCDFHSEAIQHMEAAVDENPNNAWAVGSLGWVLYQAGEYDRSLKESHRALDLDAAETWIIQTLGHAYLAKNLPDDAEREYRRLVKGRKGGEDFVQVIREVKDLLSQKPHVRRGPEILQLLEEEQRKLEAEENSVGATGSS